MPSPSQLKEIFRQFIDAESINDHLADLSSKVDPKYRPGSGNSFKIGYLEIPVDSIHLVGGVSDETTIHQHALIERGSTKYLRFFVHPESERLYEPLIERHSGYKGYYNAMPTASTRTLLVWDETRPELDPIFAKISLDRKQFGLVRLVPDWEVRRSVAVSKLAALTPEDEWRAHGVELIQEPLGAYVGADLERGSFVDRKQYHVFQHGLIFRSTEFLRRFEGKTVCPLFSLFSKRALGEPLIIQWWKKSGERRFEDFLIEAILKPFIRATSYLCFEQGLVPDSHGQNVVMVLDPETFRVEKVLHRDLGSMKVSLKLRVAKGLPIDPLRTFNATADFKFRWAEGLMGSSVLDWFYNYVFGDSVGHQETLLQYVPNYSPDSIRFRIAALLKKEIATHLPLRQSKTEERPAAFFNENDVEQRMNSYLEEQAPPFLISARPATSIEELEELEPRVQHTQDVEIPIRWLAPEIIRDKKPRWTEIGFVLERKGKAHLALTPLTKNAPGLKYTHYETDAPRRSLFAAQLVRAHLTRTPLAQLPFNLNGALDVFPAILAGTTEEPIYHIVDGIDRAIYLLSSDPNKSSLRVEVLEDLIALSPDAQERVLSQAGDFWVPSLATSSYRTIPLEDVPESPWIDYYWTLTAEQRELLIVHDYLPEIDLARQLHLALSRKLGDELNSVRDVNDIVAWVNGC